MGFFGEKLFGKKAAPAAEKAPAEAKTEDVNESSEDLKKVEAANEATSEKEEAEKTVENAKTEEGEKSPEGPASFEISSALSSSLDKLVNACASGSPIDIDQALSRCSSALSEYKGQRFKDSDASITVLRSLQKAVNGANSNFFLGMRKNTVMLQVGALEKTFNNLID